MCVFGFWLFFDLVIQVLIIVMFYVLDDLNYDFKWFYQEVKKCGYILYLGKLIEVEMFCVGCIGYFGEVGILGVVVVIVDMLCVMGVCCVLVEVVV